MIANSIADACHIKAIIQHKVPSMSEELLNELIELAVGPSCGGLGGAEAGGVIGPHRDELLNSILGQHIYVFSLKFIREGTKRSPMGVKGGRPRQREAGRRGGGGEGGPGSHGK